MLPIECLPKRICEYMWNTKHDNSFTKCQEAQSSKDYKLYSLYIPHQCQEITQIVKKQLIRKNQSQQQTCLSRDLLISTQHMIKPLQKSLNVCDSIQTHLPKTLKKQITQELHLTPHHSTTPYYSSVDYTRSAYYFLLLNCANVTNKRKSASKLEQE